MQNRYEYADGGKLGPEWKGRQVPIIPEWVREQLSLPPRYRDLPLAKEIKGFFNPTLYEAAVAYLLSWPEKRQEGSNLVFVGPTGFKEAQVSAGLINEIVLRYRPYMDVNAAWFSTLGGLPFLLDAKNKSDKSEYVSFRNKFMTADILVVDNPLAVEEIPGGRGMLAWLYGYRYEQMLPTITTLKHREVDGDLYQRMADVLGRTLARQIYDGVTEFIYSE